MNCNVRDCDCVFVCVVCSCNAIACRDDLQPVPSERSPFGAIDGKVSSVRHATGRRPPPTDAGTRTDTQTDAQTGVSPEDGDDQAKKFFVRMGPTHDQQPVSVLLMLR